MNNLFPKTATITILFTFLASMSVFGKGAPEIVTPSIFSSIPVDAHDDHSVLAQLGEYIQPFFDYIDMDSKELVELHIEDTAGNKVLSIANVNKCNPAFSLLPKGNYNLVFEFENESHDIIFIKK